MNVIYPKWKEASLQGLPGSALTLPVLAFFASAGYVYSAAHQFLSDFPSAARVAAPRQLAAKTFVNGTFNADDLLFPAVTGPAVTALILVIQASSESASRLVAYFDELTGMPFAPAGLDQPVLWNSSGVFQI